MATRLKSKGSRGKQKEAADTEKSIPNALTWKSLFHDTFESLEDYPLDPSAHGSFDALRSLIYNSKGTASYKCNKCKRSWQSINALVEFEYRLARGSPDFGFVKLMLNGQKCKGNGCQAEFVKPMFHDESIQHVLEKLLVKVKEKFYDEEVEDLQEKFENLQLNHQLTGRGSHIPELCEGCMKGLCNSKPTTFGRVHLEIEKLDGKRGRGGYSAPVNDIYVQWEIKFE